MNNYELARAIVTDVLNKVRSDEGVMYMEYVRSVETLLNKYAAQQERAVDGSTTCAKCGADVKGLVYCKVCGTDTPRR